MDESSATLRDSGVLDKQEEEYVSFCREEEIYNLSSLDLFIPQSPHSSHEENLSPSSRSQPRKFLLQGEMLSFYAIFTPNDSQLIETFAPVLSMKDDEETKARKQDPFLRLCGIVRHSAFFQNLRFEISFRPSMESATSMEVITETQPSHVPRVNAAQSWNTLARQNQMKRPELGTDDLPFILLETGEIAFPLQVPIALEEEFFGDDIQLRCMVTPVCFPEQTERRLDGILSYLMSSPTTQRFPRPRTAHGTVKLLQPLSISLSQITTMNNVDYVNICLSNNGENSITLTELKIHSTATLIRAKLSDDYLSEDTWNLPNHFSITLQHDQLPIQLGASSSYSFILKSKPNYEMITQPSYSLPEEIVTEDVLSWVISSQLTAQWESESTRTPIISYLPFQWESQKHQDLLLSISTPSPSPLNQLFDVSFNVTNLSRKAKNLQLQLDPEETSSKKLFCLEKSAHIGRLDAHSSISLILPFLALDEGIFPLDKIHLTDPYTPKKVFHFIEPCEIYVRKGTVTHQQ